NTARGIATYALESAGAAEIAFPHAPRAASGEGPHARHAGPTRLHLPERRPALVGEYPRRRPSPNRGGRTYVPFGAAGSIQRHAGRVLGPRLTIEAAHALRRAAASIQQPAALAIP